MNEILAENCLCVLTSPPASGKTTLLLTLEKEIGRKIIFVSPLGFGP